ncbi:MAG: hypothetical protein HQK55_16865 [Deltaproteobacteria bacterium]|nr:hypothetical protein [Deltaproteobacteria bacterium]
MGWKHIEDVKNGMIPAEDLLDKSSGGILSPEGAIHSNIQNYQAQSYPG